MGCCQSNEEDKYPSAEPSETSRLLNPVIDAPNSRSSGITTSSHVSHHQPKGDEQSVLNRILHQTARNVIDFASSEIQSLEQHEYQERTRQYSSKLAVVLSNSARSKAYGLSIGTGIASPQIVLSAPTLSTADMILITVAAEKASGAMKEVYVHHKEDLVVPFGVP